MRPVNSIYICTLLFVLSSNFSCKKFVTVDPPPDQLVSSSVFKTDNAATSAVLGIYAEMMNNASQFTSGSTTLYAGLSADELRYYFPSLLDEFYQNQITEASHGQINGQFWQPAYKYIYAANMILENLNKSQDLSQAVKNQLKGEASFVRAFSYFYLINLFGDVPLELSTDYQANGHLPRSSSQAVYQQIVSDLKEAKPLLSESYMSPSNTITAERTRPNVWAARALLARVYLYLGDWIHADEEASAVIDSAGLYSLVSDPSKVFLKNSTEAIWQLQPVNPSQNTWESRSFLPGTSNAQPAYVLRDEVVSTFEPGDKRKQSWVQSRMYLGQNYYYPYKYRVFGNNAPLTEYYTVLRLAEQYLIRAEARTHRGNIPGAQADMNTLRTRAGLPATSAADTDALAHAIEHERQVELFAEWGHRWLDLKRTGRASTILAPLKGSSWQPTDILWPIPQNEINLNSSLTQNNGY